jgi:hypothetical protein
VHTFVPFVSFVVHQFTETFQLTVLKYQSLLTFPALKNATFTPMIPALRNLIELDVPESFMVVNHAFYDYDPTSEFSEIENLMYLNEDLFQANFDENELILDLGWYGDVRKNKGDFVVKLIQNNHWDAPVVEIPSKSLAEAHEILSKTMTAIHAGVFND